MENIKQNICLQFAWRKKKKKKRNDTATNLSCFAEEPSSNRICLGLFIFIPNQPTVLTLEHG